MDITQILRGESSKDCECCAWAQFECACGAQWPESVAREAADELDRLRAELAELRARAGELERQVRDKHEAATVDEICNAYESGVGHRGRPTANVNPYRQGTAGHVAYRLGATGTKHNAPQDDARDAERYRFLRDQSETGAVRTLLPLVRSHYVIVNESAYDHPTFDAAVDAAIAFAQQPLAGETP